MRGPTADEPGALGDSIDKDLFYQALQWHLSVQPQNPTLQLLDPTLMEIEAANRGNRRIIAGRPCHKITMHIVHGPTRFDFSAVPQSFSQEKTLHPNRWIKVQEDG